MILYRSIYIIFVVKSLILPKLQTSFLPCLKELLSHHKEAVKTENCSARPVLDTRKRVCVP